MKHPFADVLRAIADGRQVQVCTLDGRWYNCPAATALEYVTEGLHEVHDFRVEAEVMPRHLVANSFIANQCEQAGEIFESDTTARGIP
jgi:hypothetical protein